MYISAKCNITARHVAETKKQMDCYSQLLENIRVTLDAGDWSMTNQALLLKDLPNVQANPGARLTCSLPQTGTIVPSLERFLKAKQLSGQAANSAGRSAQPLSY